MSVPASTDTLRLADHRFGTDVADRVAEVLAGGHLTLGPRVEEFERLVADEVGIEHAVAVSSGTTALHLAIAALGIEPGDEVIVPDFTHPATGNVVLQHGARPVLVDVEETTYDIDPERLAAALTERTKLVIAVDLFGLPAKYPDIEPLLEERGIPLLCDAACSIGARVGEVPAGRQGVAATYSFHPRKVLTTGEGGMVVTADDELAARLRRLRNHGGERHDGRFTFLEGGFNYRLSDVLAAIGIAQMPQLADAVARRNALAARLTAALEPLPGIRPPVVPDGLTSAFQAYVTLLDEHVDRDRVIGALGRAGVESTIGTYAMHAQPAYAAAVGTQPGDLPVSWALARRTLALPVHPRLADGDVDRIASAVATALDEAS